MPATLILTVSAICNHSTWFSTPTVRPITVEILSTSLCHSLTVHPWLSLSSLTNSEHTFVQLSVSTDLLPLTERLVQGWQHVDRDKLRGELEASQLCADAPPNNNADQLFDTYNTVLLDIAVCLAPAHIIRYRPRRPTPWFDADCRRERRHCRRLQWYTSALVLLRIAGSG